MILRIDAVVDRVPTWMKVYRQGVSADSEALKLPPMSAVVAMVN